MKESNRSRLMMVTSMAIFGTLAPFVRRIGITSGELALYRALMAAALIGLFLLVTRQKIPFAKIKKEVPLLLASGMAMGINWILLFEAYKYTTVSVATLSYYFAPVLVTLACPLLFKEKLGKLQKVKLLILGAMQTLDPSNGDSPEDMDEDCYGIWLELQAAWMSVQEAICKIAVRDMEDEG